MRRNISKNEVAPTENNNKPTILLIPCVNKSTVTGIEN